MVSLDSGMRKSRRVVPITRGERTKVQLRSETNAPVPEEIRILTCRRTSASMTFHLGPPLFLRHATSNPQSPAGKLLPFPSAQRTPLKNKPQNIGFLRGTLKLVNEWIVCSQSERGATSFSNFALQ